MKQNRNKNNILRYAIAGVLLIVATFAFAISNHLNESAAINTPAIITCMLGISAVAMLTKAIKENGDHDSDQMEQI